MAKKKQKLSLSIREWCKKQSEGENTLELCWEGGGDSGWVYFQKNGQTLDDEYARLLVDMMYDTLDYGSWAGEFSASGTAEYNPETECFEGTDNYSEDDYTNYKTNIKVVVPADIHFDLVRIEISEEGECSVDLEIKNGMYLYDKETAEGDISESLAPQIEEVINKFSKKYTFSNISYGENIPRSQFKAVGDTLVYTIQEVQMGFQNGEDKEVVLDVSKLTKAIKKEKDEA